MGILSNRQNDSVLVVWGRVGTSDNVFYPLLQKNRKTFELFFTLNAVNITQKTSIYMLEVLKTVGNMGIFVEQKIEALQY